jgi:hypothetical protein
MRLKKKDVSRMALSIAILISLVLLVTAYGKLFHPAASLKGVDRVGGLFELILLGLLVVFRHSGRMWLSASVVFGAWGGYAWFWTRLELPCGCMGELLHIPSPLSLALDLLFIALSFMMAYFLKIKKVSLCGTVACSAIAGGVGFFSAEAIYRYWVLI